MMRGAASFHADEAAGKLGKERQNLRPPQRFADNNVSFSVDSIELKYALGQIEADRGDLHGGWLLYRVVAATAPLPTVTMPSTGGGAIHMG
ncbi:msl5982 [Mesorhizobium japonicum MAFF 303099]|uniref:Msl5982 protein n=1 Tax=Mesorhizobium japonicum (strain LMG 29417 / CECT 9101 / MAFF 303099) TaxID=266835 RepID=Q98AI9_RHILO|nr:msl5982 [Mesorhizobium japonicum MAFF 303099]